MPQPLPGFRPSSTPHLQIRNVPWSNPVGAALREACHAELQARSGGSPSPGLAPAAADPATVFLVAYERSSGQPLGCGGLRETGMRAEFTDVYVLPYARGSGVAEAIHQALRARARALGYGEPSRSLQSRP